jgi:hypothetical protein
MVLDGMEKRIKDPLKGVSVQMVHMQVNLVRYADDFVITGPLQPSLN